MGGAEERKARNEKKDVSPPKGRKKLDFRTPSPANSKPLKGKNIYLDLKNYRKHRSLENDLKFLGANVVTFFSKDIKFVITNQGQPKDYKDEGDGSSGAPSPAVSTPSPFHLGHGRSVNSPQTESSGTADGQKVALTIRGKSIASKAKTFSARGSNDVLQNAKTFGAKIVHVDTALGWIVKVKEKLPKEQKVAGKPSAAKGKLPERLLKSKKLKNPFIKFESTNKHYRPIYKQLDSWPKLDASTPSGTCPFDGTAFRGGARAERAEREEREERDCSEDRSSGEDKPKRDSSKARGRTDSADFMDSGHIVTAGEMRRKKDAKRKAEQKRGFCELCGVKFDDINKHVRVEEHQKFAKNDKNYENLDELITGNGKTLEVFIKDLVAYNAEKREKSIQMRSEPTIDQTSVPRSKPSSTLSKSPRGQSGPKSCKSPSIRKKGARESPRLLSQKRNSPRRQAVVSAEVNVSMEPEEGRNSVQSERSPPRLMPEVRISPPVVEDFSVAMSSILKESQAFDLNETVEDVQVSQDGAATVGDCEVEVNNNIVETAERNNSEKDSRKRTRSAQRQFDIETDVSQNETDSLKVENSETEDPLEVICRIQAEKTDTCSSEDAEAAAQASEVDSNVLKSPKAPLRTLNSNKCRGAENEEILSPRRSLRSSGSLPAVEGLGRKRTISGHSLLESACTSQESTVSVPEAETLEHVTAGQSPVKDGAVSQLENTSSPGTRSRAKMLSPDNSLLLQTVEGSLEEKENLRVGSKSLSLNLGVQHEGVDDDGQTLVGIVSPCRRSTRITPVRGSPGRMILNTPPQKNITAVLGDRDGMMEISSPQKKHGQHLKLSIHEENSLMPNSNVGSSPASSQFWSGTHLGQVLNSPGRALRSGKQVMPSPVGAARSPTSSYCSPGGVRDSALLLSPRQVQTPPSRKKRHQNSDDSASLNVLLCSPVRCKNGSLLSDVVQSGSSPMNEKSTVLFGHKMFIRGERISSPGRVILDRHLTEHRAISGDVMMGYEAVVEKVKNHGRDSTRSSSPPPRNRLSRGKLEFNTNATAQNADMDLGGSYNADTDLGKACVTDTDGGVMYHADTDSGNAYNTDDDIGSMDTNKDIGVKPDSVTSTPCIGDIIRLSGMLKAWDHIESKEDAKVGADVKVRRGRKKHKGGSDVGEETNRAQTDVDGAGTLESKLKTRKPQVTDIQEDGSDVPPARRTRSNSVESTDASSESSSIEPEPIFEGGQENKLPVLQRSTGEKSLSQLIGDGVQDMSQDSRVTHIRRSPRVASIDPEIRKDVTEEKERKRRKLRHQATDAGKTDDESQAGSAGACLSVTDSCSLVHKTDAAVVESPVRRTFKKGRKSRSELRSEDVEVGSECAVAQKQESPVVERRRRKSLFVSTAGDSVQESTSIPNTRSRNTEDEVISILPVSSSRQRNTGSSSVETAVEDSGRSKSANRSVPRKHNLEEDIESVVVALRCVLKKCDSSENTESKRDLENRMPASENLALCGTADEQCSFSELVEPKPQYNVKNSNSAESEIVESKHEEDMPQNVDNVSSFAEEFDLVPLRITRKFFKDVSSGAFDRGSRSSSPVSTQSAVPLQSTEGKLRPRIKSTSSSASADLKVSAVSEIRPPKKRRKLDRKAPKERLNDHQSTRLTRRQACSRTDSVSHIRSGLLSPESTKREASRNGNMPRSKIEDQISDQDFPSESEMGFVGGFEPGSESEGSSTWDQNCDSYVARLCETPCGKLCGDSSAAETSQGEVETPKRDAARDMGAISHRRSPRVTIRKLADLKEKDSPRSRLSSPNKLVKSALSRSIKLLNSPKSSKTKTSDEAIKPVVVKDAVVGDSPGSLQKLLRSTHNCDEDCSSSHESECAASEDGMSRRRKRKWKESKKMRAGKRKNRIPLDRSRYQPGSEPNDIVSESESVTSVQDDMHSQALSSADLHLETKSDVGNESVVDKGRKGRRKSRSRSRVGADSTDGESVTRKGMGLNSGIASEESCVDVETAAYPDHEVNKPGYKRRSSTRGKTGLMSNLENASKVQHDYDVNCSISSNGSIKVEHRIMQVDSTESEVSRKTRNSRQRTRSRVCVDEASEIGKDPLQTDNNDVNSPRGLRVNRALMSLKSAVDLDAPGKSDNPADTVECEATDSGHGVSQSSAETCPVTPRGKRYTIAELVSTTPRSCRKDAVDMAKQVLKAATPSKRSVNKVILESIRMSSPTAELEPRLGNETAVDPERDDECRIELSSPRRKATQSKYGQQTTLATPRRGERGGNSVAGESDRHLSDLADSISPSVGSKLRLKRKRPLSSDGAENFPSGNPKSEFSSFTENPVQGEKFSLPDVCVSPGIGPEEVGGQKSAKKRMMMASSEKDLDGSVLVVHMNSPQENCLSSSKGAEKAAEKVDFGHRKSDPLTSPVLKTAEAGAPHSKGKDKRSKGSTKRKHSEIFLPFGNLKHITSKAPPGEKPKSPKKKLLKKLSDRPKSYRLGMDRLFTTKTMGPSKGKVACGCSYSHGAKSCKNQARNASCVKQGKMIKNKSVNKVAWDYGQNPKARNSPKRAAAQAANQAIASPNKTIYGSIKRKQPTSPSPKTSAHSAARKKLELAKSHKSYSPSMTSRLSRGTVASTAKVRQKLNMSPAKRKKLGDKMNKLIDANVSSVPSVRKVSLRERNAQIRYDYSDEDFEDEDPYSLI